MRVFQNWNGAGNFMALMGLVMTSACAPKPDDPAPDPLDFATTGEALAGQAAFEADILSNQFSLTNIQQIPTSGSVGYQGFVQFATAEQAFAPADDPLFAIGRVEMSASFDGTGGISGTADNFIDGNDNQMTGSMTISADSIDSRSIGTGFNGTLEGQITSASNFEYNYQVPTSGFFLGPDADYIQAGGFGDFTNNDTGEVTPFEVGILAQR